MTLFSFKPNYVRQFINLCRQIQKKKELKLLLLSLLNTLLHDYYVGASNNVFTITEINYLWSIITVNCHTLHKCLIPYMARARHIWDVFKACE